jgi:hypothetical protein
VVTAELVRRCGELKGELVAFTRASRFARRVVWTDVNRIDHFILQKRLPDGRTMIDLFVPSRPVLSENERLIVLGWRNVVETVIEVRGHIDDTVEGVGVIDELPYRVHSTKPVRRLEVGSFLITRIVPVAADWLFSGESQSFPASSRRAVLRLAAQLAVDFPALLFRNPDVLAQARKQQAADRRRFMDYRRNVDGPPSTDRCHIFPRARARQASRPPCCHPGSAAGHTLRPRVNLSRRKVDCVK